VTRASERVDNRCILQYKETDLTEVSVMNLRAIISAFLVLFVCGAAQAQEKTAEEYFRDANTAFMEGGYADAVGLYQKAILERDDFKEAWYNMGSAYGQLRKYEKEMNAYRKALELDETYARAHYNLALALEDSGKFDEALVEYELTLKYEPEALDAIVNMGILLSRLDRLEAAEKVYARALELDSGEADVYYNLGIVYSKRAKKAVEDLQRKKWLDLEVEAYVQALDRRPSFYKACYNLALAYNKLGQLDEEIAAYEKALTIKRSYPEGLYNLAYAWEEKGDLGKAVEYWKKYIEVAARYESEKPYVEMAEKELKRLEEAGRDKGPPANQD